MTEQKDKTQPVASTVEFLNAIHAALELDRPIRSATVSVAIDAAPTVQVEFFVSQGQAQRIAAAMHAYRSEYALDRPLD